MKKVLLFVLFVLVFFITSCNGLKNLDGGHVDDYDYEKMDGGGISKETSPSLDGDVPSDVSGVGDKIYEPGDGNYNYPKAGQLTACALFDAQYYPYWQSLLMNQEENKGVFNKYYFNPANGFFSQKRIKINLGEKVTAAVSLYDQDNLVTKVISTKDGVAYLYGDKLEGNTIKVEYLVDNNLVTKNFDYNGEEEVSFVLDDYVENKADEIDIMFVIDTTGSMGDEIRYLQAEIDNVINTVQAENENTLIRVALLFYRDITDAQSTYLLKYFDFSTDINIQKAELAKQFAGGGGDFEEAVHLAMAEAVSKTWSENATKLLIHVADAPSHQEDVKSWANSVNICKEKGIRIITVASSGIDKLTEFYFRSQSLITQGCYVYLTDDSGIGNSHLEATVEEKPVVEYLNKCLIRLINGYHKGVFAEPIYYKDDLN